MLRIRSNNNLGIELEVHVKKPSVVTGRSKSPTIPVMCESFGSPASNGDR